MNNIVRKVFQLALLVIAVVLGYLCYNSIFKEIEFAEEKDRIYALRQERMLQLRDAQLAYFDKKKMFADNLDSLIFFIKNDTIIRIKQIGDAEDSAAVADGLVVRDTILIPVIQYLFEDMSYEQADELKYINESEKNKIFKMETSFVGGGLHSRAAPTFLIEDADPFDVTDTLRVGSIEEIIPGFAGNWE